MDLVDLRLGSNFKEDQVMRIIDIAFLCTDVSLSVRPAMSSVVRMLEGGEEVHTIVSDSSFSKDQSYEEAVYDMGRRGANRDEHPELHN